MFSGKSQTSVEAAPVSFADKTGHTGFNRLLSQQLRGPLGVHCATSRFFDDEAIVLQGATGLHSLLGLVPIKTSQFNNAVGEKID